MSALPASYKPIAHYLKIAQEYASRDPVVYYWLKYYALQQAMQIDKKSVDCVKFLTSTLEELEKLKKAHKDNEALTNDIVGQAHMEESALKLFTFADQQDKNSIFNKNVVKAFYTAGHMFDILTLFGELDEKIAECRKYAKWKAAYIHNCLKNGETPQPGPFGGDTDNVESDLLQIPGGASGQPGVGPSIGFNPSINVPPPMASTASAPELANINVSTTSSKMDVYLKAQKLCKQAASALDYEDEKTAIESLTKALNLLKA